jgi:hypothetical protein
MHLIGAIGNDYPDPAIDARADPTFQPPFSRASARSVSYRELAFFFLTNLHKEVRRVIGQVYLDEIAGNVASEHGLTLLQAVSKTLSERKIAELELALLELTRDELLSDRLFDALWGLGIPQLDERFPGIMFVDYWRPTADLLADVKDVVADLKSQYGVPEKRRRADKWGEYLDVWDRREGWVVRGYDGKMEMRIHDIAAELRLAAPTVQSHHKTAFKLITGQNYDPELWVALFGTVKMEQTKSAWASWRKRKPRGATQSLSGESRNPGTTAYAEDFQPAGTSADDWDFNNLISDIKSLIVKGRNDDEIVLELDMQVSTQDMALIRDRLLDGLL